MVPARETGTGGKQGEDLSNIEELKYFVERRSAKCLEPDSGRSAGGAGAEAGWGLREGPGQADGGHGAAPTSGGRAPP